MTEIRRYPVVTTLLTLTMACGGTGAPEPEPGAEVTIEMPDGSLVTGKVTDPAPAQVAAPQEQTVAASTKDEAQESVDDWQTAAEPAYVEVRVPAGTTLMLELDSALASNISRVEDPVTARIDRTVVIDGVTVIPDGSLVRGTVTAVEASGKVKGRARLAFRFDQLDIDRDQYALRSETVSFEAQATKKDDAKKIGIGAGAGAVIGGLLGGGKGAGAGAAIGGGAGTAMVLTTAGEEVELRPGTPVEVALAQELVVLVSKG